MMKDSNQIGHVYLCEACAEKVGLRETFMMIVGKRPCEGCGTPIGWNWTLEPAQDVDGRACKVPCIGNKVAECMQMWRNKMWPVAFGIGLQDFAGAHVHEWERHGWSAELPDGRKNFTKVSCRCGASDEHWDGKVRA